MVNSELLLYVKTHLKKGVSRNALIENLASQGWPRASIGEAINVVDSEPAEIPPLKGSTASATQVQDSAVIAPVQGLIYAGFWLRLCAAAIDLLIVAISTSFLSSLVFNLFESPGGFVIPYFVLGLLPYLAGFLYYILMESSSFQGTLGKMALSLKVTDLEGDRISAGRAIARLFAKLLSGFIVYIGFIMIAFTPKKQGLHDMIAQTLVVKKTRN